MEQKRPRRPNSLAFILFISITLGLAAALPATTTVMQAWSGSDGPFNAIAMDGNTLYQGADTGGGVFAGFQYYHRPAGVNFTVGATLYLEVDYKDFGGPGRIGCQYNAVGNAFQAAGMVLGSSVQNSGGYKTAVMRLDQASFSLSENGGNDLRLTRTQNLQFYIKEVRVSDTPGPIYLAQTAFMGPYSGPLYAGAAPVDASSMLGKMVVGYQGWFRTPNDDDDFNWAHWTRSWGNMAAGLISEDFWPQMDEFTAAERHAATGYTYPDGSQAELFSSDNARTVLRHFQWMEAYGIDGAGVQRFTNGLNSPSADGYRVLSHVRSAANQTGRTYFVEYDMTGTPENQLVSNIANDWHTLVDSLQLPADGRYLRQGGLPVVGVYGFFPDRFSTATANAILDIFQTPGPYQAFVAGAGMWSWRFDAAWTAPWKAVVYRMGSWQPWNCGNYLGSKPAIYANTTYWAADKADLDAHGVIYVPEIYPGGSADNRDGVPPGTSDMPRQTGSFLWKQFVDAYNTGVQSTFLGMFDELDEGTQILKVTASPPTQSVFKAYEGQPSDCYLCFAGLGSKMLKGQIAYTTTKPDCTALTQPSIPDPVAPLAGAVVAGPNVGYSWLTALALPGGGSLTGYEVLLDGVTVTAASLSQVIATVAGAHVWRVRARNSLGNAGGWSLPQRFTVTGPTATPTATRTSTGTPTRSPSPTLTASPSRTASPSLTGTPTLSPSPTPSCSPTATRTASPSVTLTGTATISATPSPTVSPTASQSSTRTLTASPTATASATPSRSASASPSGTFTASPLASATVSPTRTGSSSPSPSATPSPTASPTASLSSTLTLTASPTATASATPGRSASASPSSTFTASPPALATVSPTCTGSFSPSPSTTVSPSAAATASPSSTLTLTASPSLTASATPSRSASASPSPSSTLSLTGTLTVTVTASPSSTRTATTATSPPLTATPPGSASAGPTRTLSVSPSPTVASTATLTPPSGGGHVEELPAKILQVVPCPNPNPLAIAVLLQGHADELQARLYGASLRRLSQAKLGACGPGWVTVPLPAEFLEEAANGVYYYRVTADGQASAGVTGKFLMLR